MENADYITVDNIMSTVLVNCNDKDYRSGYTEGYYVDRIQYCMEQMALDSYYKKLSVDIEYDPIKLQVPMVKNMFNIKEVYVHSGSCCQPENAKWVHWKRTYDNNPGGTSYTARMSENSGTPILPQFGSAPSNLYYAGVQNGLVKLSPSCASFNHIRFIGNGFDGDVCEVPCIPRWFRDAIVDFICEEFFRVQLARNPSERSIVMLQQLYNRRLNGDGRRVKGSWEKAIDKVKMMDSWQRDNMIEYLTKKW